ncbi:NmrA family NAD(P)-binding protein [Planobispora takensis]|uniref:NmrA family transcriptional regulator n=1 Tax=Planobispora takensis TaxID=1367882 RepID=A0A8J3WU49_9ACTN|nr:NAD(P)H-binding protein [Planobispora takensis]GIH99556.1 NmrA family transcriptional regulator [Planobispora takensis]
MTENTTQNTTLVIGSTGKTGRRVAARLRARGLAVREGSRSANPPFDWNDRATWEPALRGVDAAYVTYQPDLAFPGAAETVRDLAAQAVAAGVRRLVLLSGRGEEGALLGEEAVRESGAEWTIVRCSWFCQNFDESHLLEPVLAGTIALPAGDVAEPFVDAEDIADVVVAALTEAGHGGRVYELTGPRLLTFAEAAAEISKACGREVRYLPVSAADYESTLVEYGVPAAEAAELTGLFTTVLDGRNAHLSDGVRRALGRGPRDFSDYARDAAATGVWNV